MAANFAPRFLVLAAFVFAAEASASATVDVSRPLGMENRTIPDSKITASSSPIAVLDPSKARLNDRTGWCPNYRTGGANQWIQVDLSNPYRITAVATQGRPSYDNWVKTYKIACSNDGVNFNFVQTIDGTASIDKVFNGNVDRYSVVMNTLPKPEVCRFVRLHPLTWQRRGCLRMELYGFGPLEATVEASLPLGMANHAIPDSSLTATSQYSRYLGRTRARLNDRSSWCPRTRDANQWIQVDLLNPYRITAVATQGRSFYNAWVKTYKIACSNDGVNFNIIQTNDTSLTVDKIFTGNRDRVSSVMNVLPEPQVCRFVRLLPVSWQYAICLRFELYGTGPLRATVDVSLPLGMESGTIPDSNITASTELHRFVVAPKGRLNHVSGWCPKSSDAKKWIQVDLGDTYRITAVATQGHSVLPYFVASYKIGCSIDGINFNTLQTAKTDITFKGNIDRFSSVMNTLVKPKVCQYVRLMPVTWRLRPCLRMELYGQGPVSVIENNALGMESELIPDSSISASSVLRPTTPPAKGRLNTEGDLKGSWCPKIRRSGQWIQVDLSKPTLVTGVATQGRDAFKQWIKTYKIECSVDGMTLHTVTPNTSSNANDKVFSGNSDQNTVVTNGFLAPEVCRYVRLVPLTWKSRGCVRMELYGGGPLPASFLSSSSVSISSSSASNLSPPLGMESKVIDDSSITASSALRANLGARKSRLNSEGGRRGSWCPKSRGANEWIQVDLSSRYRITAVATQGRADANQWVLTYKLACSDDGKTFKIVKNKGDRSADDVVFMGNTNRNSVVKNTLPAPVECRYVRLLPISWKTRGCLRMELYGEGPLTVAASVSKALGMESKVIPDASISASSTLNMFSAPARSRLNTRPTMFMKGAWSAGTNDANQWIQVYLGKLYRVTAVATQGRNEKPEWVTSYKIACSLNGANFIPVKDTNQNAMVFTGNTDQNTVVKNTLPKPQSCRYVRLLPVTWNGRISLRMELYGEGPIRPSAKREEDSEILYNFIEKEIGNEDEMLMERVEDLLFDNTEEREEEDMDLYDQRDFEYEDDFENMENTEERDLEDHDMLYQAREYENEEDFYEKANNWDNENVEDGEERELEELEDLLDILYQQRGYENDDDLDKKTAEDTEERELQDLVDMNNQQRDFEQGKTEGLEQQKADTMLEEYGEAKESPEKKDAVSYLLELLLPSQ